MSQVMGFFTYTAKSLKKVSAAGGLAEGWAAFLSTALSLLSVSFGARNVGFRIVTLLVMTLELMTGIARAYLDPNEVYTQRRLWGGLVAKLLRLTLVLLAALLDWTMVFVFPYSAEAIGRLMPTTKGAFVWLIVAEASSILQNIRHSQGDTVVPAVLMRALDRLRVGGKEPPMGRHYDKAALDAERRQPRRFPEPMEETP
jgi:phage-related holin